MAEDDDPATPRQRLQALVGAYAAEPDRAEALLDELLRLALSLSAPEDRLLAARLAGEMALERRNPRAAVGLIEEALRDGPVPPAVAAELHSQLARSAIQELRFDDAREQLQAGDALAGDAALPQALLLAARAQLAHREAEMALSEQLAQEALKRFSSLNWRGPWVQVYATLAIARRELGAIEGRAQALRDGLARCRAQHRWGEACNLATGLFDMAVESGDLDGAAQALRDAEALAQRESGGADAPGHAMVHFSRARWLAANGRYVEACAGMREALAAQRHRLVAYEYALRLDQLADWLLLAGEPDAALAAAAEAQQLQLEQAERSHQRSLDVLRQGLQVEQAERERLLSQQHAQRMETQQAALAQTLQRQRELHAALVEARKLAGLGELLMSLARSLDPPLREAAQLAAQAEQGSQQGLERVSSGAALSRRQLMAELELGQQACVAGQRQVERATAELQQYRSLRNDA
ncbi:MAG: hypothetical protein J0L58_20285 [Burkholderiales bacterium]|nr:hypothetical protein [Burkholderiales bacterium]